MLQSRLPSALTRLACVFLGAAALLGQDPVPERIAPPETPVKTMELGAFSVSLAVKDIAVSRAFYAKLGFEVVGGDPEQNWQILRNGTTTIGLFQGLFEGNILTFNPGWSPLAQPLKEFESVRAIQRRLLDAGVELTASTDPDGTGPANIVVTDPDGNTVLIDQHVD